MRYTRNSDRSDSANGDERDVDLKGYVQGHKRVLTGESQGGRY